MRARAGALLPLLSKHGEAHRAVEFVGKSYSITISSARQPAPDSPFIRFYPPVGGDTMAKSMKLIEM